MALRLECCFPCTRVIEIFPKGHLLASHCGCTGKPQGLVTEDYVQNIATVRFEVAYLMLSGLSVECLSWDPSHAWLLLGNI